MKTEKEFGKFDVAQVDKDYLRLGKYNPGKQIEFGNLYVIISHLFDAALQVVNIIHTATLSHATCKALALVA